MCLNFKVAKHGNINLLMIIALNAVSDNQAYSRLMSQTKRTLKRGYVLISEEKHSYYVNLVPLLFPTT